MEAPYGSVAQPTAVRLHEEPWYGENTKNVARYMLRRVSAERLASAGLVANSLVCILYVGVGTLVGWRLLQRFERTAPGFEDDDDVAPTWPDLPGMTAGVSVIGSAISFLLVFRLSWSFQRWWEAWGLLGTATTKLRNLAVIFMTNHSFESAKAPKVIAEMLAVSKIYVAVVIDELARETEAGPPQRLSRSSVDRSVAANKGRLNKSDVPASIELALEDSSDVGITEADKRAVGDARLLQLLESPCRVLTVHAWLCRCIGDGTRVGLINNFEHHAALDCQQELLKCYYSSLKIKQVPLPLGIKLLIFVIKFSYCVVLYPSFMAYAYVEKLNATQRARKVLESHAFFYTSFFTLVGLGIMFFVVLHLVANELDDPYGNDVADLPLLAIRQRVWTDLEDIARIFPDALKMPMGDDDEDDYEANAKIEESGSLIS